MSARGHHGVRNPKKAKKNPYDKRKPKRGSKRWDDDVPDYREQSKRNRDDY